MCVCESVYVSVRLYISVDVDVQLCQCVLVFDCVCYCHSVEGKCLSSVTLYFRPGLSPLSTSVCR